MSGEGEIIRDGIDITAMRPYIRATNPQERLRMLLSKLITESGEAATAESPEAMIEELGDVVEIAFAIDQLVGKLNPDLGPGVNLMRLMIDKGNRVGTFTKGKALAWEPWADYAHRQAAVEELAAMDLEGDDGSSEPEADSPD